MAIKKVAVLGGVSRLQDDIRYTSEARRLGELLAGRCIHVVCSGSQSGLIGELIEGVAAGSGSLTAIVLDNSDEWSNLHAYVSVASYVNSIGARKASMVTAVDGFIALPGGIGTHDEIFSLLAERKVGVHSRPLVMLNVAGFFDPIAALTEHMVRTGFLNARHLGGVLLESNADNALAALEGRWSAARTTP